MNIFLEYRKKISSVLKILEKKKILKIPKNYKNFTIELPPEKQKADISCNVALLLAKHNNIPSIDLAKIIKKHL